MKLIFSIIALSLFLGSCSNTEFVPVHEEDQVKAIDSLLIKILDARSTEPSSIVMLSDSVIQLSEAIDYDAGILKGKYNKATGYFYQNQFEEANSLIEHILEEVRMNPRLDSLQRFNLIGSAFLLSGIILQRQGKYQKAIEQFLIALKQFERSGESENIASTYSNISENFRSIKNYDKAAYYNRLAEKEYIKANKNNRLLVVYQNRGNILFDQRRYSEALQLFQTTLESATTLNDSDNIVNALNNIGACYEKIGKLRDALEQYEKALNIYRKRQDFWGEATTLGNISYTHFASGNTSKAIFYTQKALDISTEHGFLELQQFNSENLTKIYKIIGDNRKALEFHEQAWLLNDSLINKQKFEVINRLEKQYNEEKANRIIIQKDRTIMETKLKSNKLASLSTILGLVFLLSIVTLFFLYRQSTLRKQKNFELTAKNNIIREQNEDLETIINAYQADKEKFIEVNGLPIPLQDIIYIRYKDRISSIFLKGGEIVDCRAQLSQLLSELQFKSYFFFSQINQNYILNLGNVTVEIGETEKEKFYYTDYLQHDKAEGRNEVSIKTRIRSSLTKNFEREYERFTRLKSLIT